MYNSYLSPQQTNLSGKTGTHISYPMIGYSLQSSFPFRPLDGIHKENAERHGMGELLTQER